MKFLWSFIKSFYTAWKLDREQRALEAYLNKKDVTDSLEHIRTTAKSVNNKSTKQKDLNQRTEKLRKRGKDLGLALIIAIALHPAIAGAQIAGGEIQTVVTEQTAEQRIQALSHEDLKAYALELATFARQESDLITDLQKQNQELTDKLDSIDVELAKVQLAIEKLGPAPKLTGSARVFRFLLKAVPTIFAGVAAIK